MTIILYKNTSEDNQINKTLVEDITLEGTLRDDTSIQDPVIVFNLGKEVFNYNYAYIPEFNRYYFIENIRTVRTNLTQISMHVDVLMSFKDEFLQNEGYIDTSLSYGNFYLNDPNLPVQQNTKITTRINYNSGFGGYSIIMNCLNIGTQTISEKTETPAT